MPTQRRRPVTARRADGSFRTFFALMNPQASLIELVFELLRKSGYDYVIVGAHARNAHVPDEPRVTRDLDLIMPDDDAERFARATLALKPGMTVIDREGFLSVVRRRHSVLDIGRASAHPLYAETLRRGAITKRVPGLGTGRVATKEALIALKLLSAASPKRKAHKALFDKGDVVDLLGRKIDAGRVERLLDFVPEGRETLRALEEERRRRG